VTNTLLLVVFAIAIALTLLSAWTFWRYAYYVIISLFAAGFMVDIFGSYLSQGSWDLKAISVDVCIFGFLLYFVTIQNVTGRKVSSVVSGEAYKAFLLENNKYRGFFRFIYHLPVVLIVGGVCTAIYWKFLSV
jgi:hypothetical protein